jgi:WD40 repeat protein
VLRGHTGFVSETALSSDGRFAGTSAWDSRAKLWDVVEEHELTSIRGAFNGFVSATISPDDSRFAALGTEGTVRIMDIRKQLVVATLKNAFGQIAFLPDNNTLLAAGLNGLRVWRAPPFTETDEW